MRPNQEEGRKIGNILESCSQTLEETRQLTAYVRQSATLEFNNPQGYATVFHMVYRFLSFTDEEERSLPGKPRDHRIFWEPLEERNLPKFVGITGITG